MMWMVRTGRDGSVCRMSTVSGTACSDDIDDGIETDMQSALDGEHKRPRRRSRSRGNVDAKSTPDAVKDHPCQLQAPSIPRRIDANHFDI